MKLKTIFNQLKCQNIITIGNLVMNLKFNLEHGKRMCWLEEFRKNVTRAAINIQY